jgi:hypothetical protein
MLVPSSRTQSELAPFVKSVVTDVPRPGSAGQFELLVGSQLVKVWPLTKASADKSAAVVEKVVERILLLYCGVLHCL